MINIRENVFETNSSSMHSLVVVKNPKPYTERELKLNCYREDRGYDLFGWSSDRSEFGRAPFQTLRTPVDKLRYYVAHELGNCERYEKIPEIKEFISKCTGVPVDQVELRVTSERKKRDYYGYIEHNDTGESPFEYIARKNISMEDLILNPKYVIIVDGDEYQEFKQLFESNILNADDFEDISSGADFWNDASCEIYINWFGLDYYTDEDCVEEVNNFVKYLDFKIDSDSRKQYNVDRINNIIKLAKAKNPNLKVRLFNTGLCGKKKVTTNGLDVSMFDEVDLKDPYND